MDEPQEIGTEIKGDKSEPITLPFDKEEGFDIGIWAYTHSTGLMVTLSFYLIIMILFVMMRISIVRSERMDSFEVDLGQLAELERQRDLLKESVERMQSQNTQWESVQNLVSNENSQSEHLPDDRGNDVDKLMQDAEAFQQRMAENRLAYERGVEEARSIREHSDLSTQSDPSERRDRQIKGSVTVSYSIVNPVRHSRNLAIPAYRCQSGGEVVVEVAVDRGGKVTGAKVISGGDDCMRSTALQAAYGSLFDINNSAPTKQSGVIRYIFVPQ